MEMGTRDTTDNTGTIIMDCRTEAEIFIHFPCSTVSRRRLRTLSDSPSNNNNNNDLSTRASAAPATVLPVIADSSEIPKPAKGLLLCPVKCVSETEEEEEEEEDDNKWDTLAEEEKVLTEDRVLRRKIDTLLGPKTRPSTNNNHPHPLTTATSTPSLARTWTCFGCSFRTKNSVTWHCINCGQVSYLAPVYKETLPFRDRRKQRQRAARLRAKRSLSVDAAERHMVRCRKCTKDMQSPPPPALEDTDSIRGGSAMIVFPWQERRRRYTNKVACVHQERQQRRSISNGSDVFGSPIKERSDGEQRCGVCGICEGQSKVAVGRDKTKDIDQRRSLGEGETRFTVTTLARRENGKRSGGSVAGGDAVGEEGRGGAGFLIAVKDWLAPKRPQRRLESGGGYQVIRKNLLNPRAQPVYNNEFHLTPPPMSVKEEESGEEVKVVVVVGGSEGKVVVPSTSVQEKGPVGSEPVYAVVNKAAKGKKHKNQIAGKYSFLTDTLSRRQSGTTTTTATPTTTTQETGESERGR